MDGNIGDRPAGMLIDSRDNKYVLSRPKDITLSLEDRKLIVDMFLVVVSAFFMSHLCNMMMLPSVIGFIAAGSYHIENFFKKIIFTGDL